MKTSWFKPNVAEKENKITRIGASLLSLALFYLSSLSPVFYYDFPIFNLLLLKEIIVCLFSALAGVLLLWVSVRGAIPNCLSRKLRGQQKS